MLTPLVTAASVGTAIVVGAIGISVLDGYHAEKPQSWWDSLVDVACNGVAITTSPFWGPRAFSHWAAHRSNVTAAKTPPPLDGKQPE